VQGLGAAAAQAAKQQHAAAAAAVADPAVPGWVRRARQSAQDITLPLLAAAAKCQPVPPDVQPQLAAVPGWLAYRLACQLPEAGSCSNAAELLQLGAAAAAIAAPAMQGAALVVPGAGGAGGTVGGKQQLAAVAGQGTELPQLDFGAAAERLLAAPRQQLHAMGLQERSKRWFGQRSGTVR
jgi:hypothetical protein